MWAVKRSKGKISELHILENFNASATFQGTAYKSEWSIIRPSQLSKPNTLRRVQQRHNVGQVIF